MALTMDFQRALMRAEEMMEWMNERNKILVEVNSTIVSLPLMKEFRMGSKKVGLTVLTMAGRRAGRKDDKMVDH